MGEIGCRRGNQNVKSGCYRKNCEFQTVCQKQIANCNRQLEPSLQDLVLKPKSNKISRPPNAFMIYAREHRKLLASKYPKENNKNISSMLGESWKKIDPSMKIQYFEKAKMLEELHKKQYPGYVYSPRVARMQKMERSKNRSAQKYCVGTNLEGERKLQAIKSKKNFRECEEKEVEWVEEESDTKLSSPEYVPNNPHYFAESEAMPKICEKNMSQLESEDRSFSGFPPSHWHALQKNTMTMPYIERNHDEYELQQGMYTDHQYRRQLSARKCSCEVCDESDHDQHSRPSSNPFLSTSNSSCQCSSADCSSSYVSSHQTTEQKNFASASPPRFQDYKNSRPTTSFEHPSTKASFHSSLPYPCRQYRDCKQMCCSFPRPPMPWTPTSFESPSFYYQDMNYFYNRNQEYLKSYYTRYPYYAPPGFMHYPGVFDRSMIKHETPDSNRILHSNESSNQDYESNELHSSDTEINVEDVDVDVNVDEDEDDDALPQKPESKVFEQIHSEGEKTLQQI